MPAKSSPPGPAAAEALKQLGARIRQRRKQLRIAGVAAAEAAGMSRVTLHRIERGESSVTMGAWFNLLAALGLELRMAEAGAPAQPPRKGWLPARIPLADYPQLKQLAWQVEGIAELTPAEALDIYERNWRHIDLDALQPHERDLVEALRAALGPGRADV